MPRTAAEPRRAKATAFKSNVPGITVYQRGETWSYTVYLDADPLTLVRSRLNKGGFPSGPDALEAAVLIKAAAEKDGRIRPPRGDLTAEQYLREWLEEIKPSIKATTYANYLTLIDAYVAPNIGHHQLKALTVETHNALYIKLAKEGRCKPDNNIVMYHYWSLRREQRGGLGPTYRELAAGCGTTEHAAKGALTRFRRGRVPKPQPPGLALKTLRNINSMLSLAWVDAIGHGYMTSDPTEYARYPRMPRTEREAQKEQTRPWTEEELGRFLVEALKDRFGPLWLMAASCGTRRCEIAGVNRLRLDLDKKLADLHDTRVVVNGVAEDSDGKTDAGWRTVSLDDFTVENLVVFLAKLGKEREAFGPTYPTHGYLFVWPDGSRVHPDTITATFNRIVDRAGVPQIRLHDIRHTYITLARNRGVNRKLLSNRVGHANETVTDTIYTHAIAGADRPVAEEMGKVIRKAVEQAS